LSRSPPAAAIHAIAFHGNDVKALQQNWLKKPSHVSINDMFTFPAADKSALTKETIQEDLNYALHGLLAYAEPWVRRGVGCSGVQDMGGTHLMEDRATARIKTAFVRNWLLHSITTKEQVTETIFDMAKHVDLQNKDKEGYQPIASKDLIDEVVEAVQNLVFNPQNYLHSYVEPYLYNAYLKYQNNGTKNKVKDFMGDW
jgi:malate synthase